MNKVGVLRVVNTVLFLSFILQAITIVIILFRIKTPNMRLIFEVHEYNGILMVVMAVTHITLNRGWIKANFFKKKGV